MQIAVKQIVALSILNCFRSVWVTLWKQFTTRGIILTQTLKSWIVMRTTNTFGVQFITRTNKAKDGLLPIYARVTVDGRRVEISLKRWIKPSDWNGSKGMAKGSREEIKSLNHYLDEVQARIMECYQEMQVQKRLITVDAIKSMFLGTDQ